MGKLFFKIFAASQSFHGVDYNEKKQKKENASLIHFENFGHLQNKSTISKEEFKEYFTLYSKRNKRIRLPQFHAVLSCKGNEFNSGQLKDYAVEIMNRLGYEGNPILIYEHTDTSNHHVHIVTSRVDKKGKKINDAFEKKRANNILSEILQLNTKEEFSRDLASSLLYQYTTEKQFLLLMELKGYKAKLNIQSNSFDFYKHGQMQGTVAASDIIRNISTENIQNPDKKKIYSIIRYYKDKYSTEPIESTCKKPYPQQKYETTLTNHLKKTFGWEFVFFRSGHHDKPYGYVIIDHAAHKVYKGNEVMKLQELLNINEAHSAIIKPTEIENKNILQFDDMDEEIKHLAAVNKPAVSSAYTLENTITTGQDNFQPFVSPDLMNELGNREMNDADSLAKTVIKPNKPKKRIKY